LGSGKTVALSTRETEERSKYFAPRRTSYKDELAKEVGGYLEVRQEAITVRDSPFACDSW